MNVISFDEEGSVIEPELHDAYLFRIDFGGRLVSLYLRGAREREIRIDLHGVAHFFSTGLAEQNILLEACVELNLEVCAHLLNRMLPGDGEMQKDYRVKILQRLSNKGTKLIRFSPSYGGEIMVLCENAVYQCGN